MLKMLSVFEIMAFKHVAGTYLNSDENTFYRKSTYYPTVLRFHICLREMFSSLICLDIMKNSNESAAVMISAVFVTHQHVVSRKVLKNSSFQAFK